MAPFEHHTLKKDRVPSGLCTTGIARDPYISSFGGTAWESNPPDQARWSQIVLKTPRPDCILIAVNQIRRKPAKLTFHESI
jgi:hypothetical protein